MTGKGAHQSHGSEVYVLNALKCRFVIRSLLHLAQFFLVLAALCAGRRILADEHKGGLLKKSGKQLQGLAMGTVRRLQVMHRFGAMTRLYSVFGRGGAFLFQVLNENPLGLANFILRKTIADEKATSH